jgi:hypothetical protein
MNEITTPVVNREQFSAVYSGRTGCCCGCRGTHSGAKGSITRVVNKIHAVANGDVPGTISGLAGVFVSADTDTRVYVAYLDGRVA